MTDNHKKEEINVKNQNIDTEVIKKTKTPVLIGAHLSIVGGFSKLKSRMSELDATCCAFFLKNQRRFEGKPLDEKDVQLFRKHFSVSDKINENEKVACKIQCTTSQTETEVVHVDKRVKYDMANGRDNEKENKEDVTQSYRSENVSGCTVEESNQIKAPIEPNSENPWVVDYLVPHASYLINMANNCTEKREKHLNCLHDELDRCAALGIKYLNIHPGSDTSKLGKENACELVAEAINQAHERNKNVIILLENMAGQGNVLCSTFQEIRMILNGVKDEHRVGVCIDTAHLHGAGYDIRTKDKYEEVMAEFDKIVGFSRLKAMHLNDSMVKLKSRMDRHEKIGQGFIGNETFKFIMQDKRLWNIPKILETPDVNKWKEEIALLRKYALEAENND